MKLTPCVHEKCTGCRACENTCPKNAIEMIKDQKGFLYPQINQNQCIQCGLCDKACPHHDNSATTLTEYNHTIKIFGLKNKNEEIRRKSSSGGTFFLLAKNTIENNGIVYGCILDENIRPVFARADTLNECLPMMGSKYVQSDLGTIFNFIEEDLTVGKKVLFTGTPCQCQGLKYYLSAKKISTDNLIIAEFLCHGASSPRAFDDLKQRIESKYKGKIRNFYFRDKEKVKNPPSSRGMRAFLIPNNEIEIMSDSNELKMLDIYDPGINDQHFELFKRNYLSRDCCYSCEYIGFDRRPGDITFADFWGCETSYPEFFDKGGISLVLLNSDKGVHEFEEIKDGAHTIEVMRDKCIQKPLVSSPTKPADFDAFWKSYDENGYVEAAKKYTRKYIAETKRSIIKGNIKRAIKKVIKSEH